MRGRTLESRFGRTRFARAIETGAETVGAFDGFGIGAWVRFGREDARAEAARGHPGGPVRREGSGAGASPERAGERLGRRGRRAGTSADEGRRASPRRFERHGRPPDAARRTRVVSEAQLIGELTSNARRHADPRYSL